MTRKSFFAEVHIGLPGSDVLLIVGPLPSQTVRFQDLPPTVPGPEPWGAIVKERLPDGLKQP